MLQAEVGADVIGQVDDGEEAQQTESENDKGRGDGMERTIVGEGLCGLRRTA